MLSKPRALILAAVAIAMISIAGCTSVSSSGKEEPTPTPLPPPPVPVQATYTVRRGEVVDSLSYTGRVSPVVEEELFFRAAGRVANVLVQRNEWVEEGQLLAELQNEDLVRQLAQAQIELDTAELNLRRASDTQDDRITTLEGQLEIKQLQLVKMQEALAGLDLDVQLASMRLAAARRGPGAEDLEIAERRVERARNSLWADQARRDATCGVPSAACDQAQAAVNNSEEALRIEELTLKKVKAGPSDEELLNLRANYEKALQRRRDADLDVAIKELEIRLSEQEIARLVESADPQLLASVERARLAVERLNAQLENTQVISTINGRVASVNAFEGREVNAYATVFVVADEADLEITAEPTTAQLQRLAEGMAVELVLSQYPGKVLLGEIYQLPYPYGRGGGSSLEATDRKTRMSFDPQDLDLKPGDLVKVDVTIEQKTDALWLAPAAIRTFAGRSFVVVRENGVERRVDVVLGIQASDRVEIREGLEEGQVVVGQ
jgi:multidrug efflux pump subunit AcrA (membrane-fusion protein)